MAKRIISVTLALIMIFGIFIVPTANAADPKILGTRTVQLGHTATVSLTDPDTGAKLDLIWESSDPSIATVTSDGKVTPHKVGTCVMTTLWNGKWYGVQVNVVSGSSSSGTSSGTSSGKPSAFQKLKNHLIKNGTKEEIHSYIKWTTKAYKYWISYNSNTKYIEYTGVVRLDSSTDSSCFSVFQYEEKNKVNITFQYNKNGKRINLCNYAADYKKSAFNIKNKIKLKYKSGKKYSNANSLANKYRKKFYPAWNKWLKSKVSVTLKLLGLMKAKKTKKIALSKKSATLKKGKTLKLKLKNAKASKVKWTSSNKKVAAVSKKGVVKAKKKGKATITAKYKGKKYTCKITVKKGGMTAAQAINKLINYLKKSDPHTPVANGDYWAVNWTKNDFKYSLMYDNDKSDFMFIGNYKGSLIIELHFSVKNDYTCYYTKLTDGSVECKMSLNQAKKSLKLDSIPDFKQISCLTAYNTANLNAKATLEWMFPEFNQYISKKAGVTMKNLGFKKWK